jgi:mannonate dehydratase
MEQTWRWFGPKDKVTLQDARHAGAEGIVTALHEIPVGSPWSIEDICDRQAEITAAGLRWSVVESLDVTEAIKTRINGRQNDIDAFIQSLRNLAACGIFAVAYNFMPVFSWMRTDLHTPPTAWWVYDELQRNCFRCFRYLHTSTT